jgi:D-alanyl-lipoteichoic acid acyltransferase DltB (MBOAT superfamily)
VRTYVNNFITMVVAGLWHGPSWMFVIWGAIHGGALVIHKFCKKLFLDKINDTPLVKFCSWLLTTLTVMAAWVFFRAKDMATAGDVFNRMFTDFDWAYLPPFATVRTMWLVFAVLALTIHWGMKESWNERIKEKMTNAHWIVKLIVFAVTVQLVINFSQDSVQPLLYAQF